MSFFKKLKKITTKTEATKTGPVKSPISENSNKQKSQEPKKLEIKTTLIELATKGNESFACLSTKESPCLVSAASKNKEWFEAEGQLAIDFFQTEQEFIIQSAIAGVKPEELEITVEDEMIIIRGIRPKLEPDKETSQNYLIQECYWGPFSRKIILPEQVDLSRIISTMKQGILTIKIPKASRERKREIKISSAI